MKGWLPAEAAAELLISHRAWLLREDVLQVAVESRQEVSGGCRVAAIDFAAAADAVQGMLPCSDGERQVRPRVAWVCQYPETAWAAFGCLDRARRSRPSIRRRIRG